MKVRIGPSRIFGACPAGYRISDEFIIDGTNVSVVKGPICYVALSAFTAQVTQIQREQRATSHLSCPGCSFDSKQDNRVIFVLGSEEAWNLSRKFSKYNWARLDGRATKISERHCDLCWKLTQARKYKEAEEAVEKALENLKPEQQDTTE
jgi:uncharacterized repeat protein (TIGR04076 family)